MVEPEAVRVLLVHPLAGSTYASASAPQPFAPRPERAGLLALRSRTFGKGESKADEALLMRKLASQSATVAPNVSLIFGAAGAADEATVDASSSRRKGLPAMHKTAEESFVEVSACE